MDTLFRTTASRIFLRCIATVLLFAPLAANSQINTYVRSVRAGQAREGTAMRVSAELSKSSELSRVVLYYRQFGQSEFRILEMPIIGDTASVTISEDEVTPPFMEVYVLAQTQSGTIETNPYENPQATPLRLSVSAKSQKDREVLILSPDKSDQLLPADIYISISFIYASDQINRSKTKIFFDNIDVSALAVNIGELTIVSPDALPKNITTGPHTLRIDVYDTTNAPYHSVERTLSVVTEQQAEAIREQVQYSANAQAEARNEDIKGTQTLYKRLNARANASYGILKTTGNIQLTSEEQDDRQPQNRYFLGLDAKYVRVGIGDAYPRFPSTVLDGRRIRGLTADLLLGPFNINYANGEIIRRVEADTLVQTRDTTTTKTYIPPTLRRNLTILRPSFGKGENFQLGFTYLKAKDEFDTSTDKATKPQENMVVGTDAVLAFDDHRFELTAQASYSLNNIDISAPEFTDATIDTSKLGSDVKDLLHKYGTKYLAKVITLNENLQPLPPGLTALVYETGLAVNYFGNYLKGSYIYHGADYISVGTTALRRDVKGFNIFDRVRLFQNRVFLTGSYERLDNNTSGRDTILTTAGKIQLTTTYQTINTSVSYYPTSNMPNFTLGYGINKNSNPIDPLDPIATAAARAIDDITNRYFLQSTYDFAYRGRHNATFSLDISSKTDNTPKKQDVSSLNAFLLVNTVHTFPLETAIGYSMSLNTIPQVSIVVDTIGGVATPRTVISSATLDYTTITLNGRYKIYKDVLKLSATFAPTFGDFKRTVLEVGLQYAITRNQNAAFQYQYIINTPPPSGTVQASNNDSYVSLLYRIDL